MSGARSLGFSSGERHNRFHFCRQRFSHCRSSDGCRLGLIQNWRLRCGNNGLFRSCRRRRGRSRGCRNVMFFGGERGFGNRGLGFLCGWRLYHYGHGGRRHGYCRTSRGCCTRRRLGHNRAGGWMRSNRRRRCGHHNIRSLADLGNNLARLGARWRSGRCGYSHHRRRRLDHHRGRRSSGRLGRQTAAPGSLFRLHLLCLDGLQNIARLGDVGEIDLGCDALGSFVRRGARRRGRVLAALKMRANLVGLMVFQRTGVRFAGR